MISHPDEIERKKHFIAQADAHGQDKKVRKLEGKKVRRLEGGRIECEIGDVGNFVNLFRPLVHIPKE